MAAFSAKIVLFFTAFCMIVNPFFGYVLHGGENYYFEKWSADQAFTREYAVELEKDPDKDFVILNLTDIQLGNEIFEEEGTLVKRNIDKLVETMKPDLITLSGDNASNFLSYIQTIKWLESYGIPWAPIMGNHDGQGFPGEFWYAYNLLNAKNCLFKFGPKDMGYGNYIINITENGEIIHSLFMMDTHSDIEKDNINGKAGSGYDHLWPNQFDWYSWGVDGIKEIAGKTVESTIIFHIPLYEYKDAYEAATGGADWEANHDLPYVGEYAETSFGSNHEHGCWSPQSNGFFDLIKEKDSTKNVICGHDHVRDCSILYQGVRLTYAVKCGPGCYWEPEMNGGTTVTISSDGHADVAHHYLDFYTAEFR